MYPLRPHPSSEKVALALPREDEIAFDGSYPRRRPPYLRVAGLSGFTLLSRIFFSASATSLMLCRRFSTKLVRPPVVSVSSICGTNTSSAVRGVRPKSSWKGIMAEGSEGSGIVRLIQQAGATYSSHLVGTSCKSLIERPASRLRHVLRYPDPWGGQLGRTQSVP